jgi:hypothetical protein
MAGSTGLSDKKKAFRRCKDISNQFRHQKASQLEKPGPLHNAYIKYSDSCKAGTLRRGTGG